MIGTVLVVHDAYTTGTPSGENLSAEAETELLRRRGHQVVTYVRRNDEIAAWGPVRRLVLPALAVWNPGARRDVAALIRTHRPAVAHVQNTFPLVSPSVLAACREAGVPVVLALRNFRYACPAATLFRDGRVCEDCLGRAVAWPAVVHGCYHGSRARSAAVAGALAVHRVLRIWERLVDLFVAPSAFARDKLAAAGLPAARIVVKPNFLLQDPGARDGPGDGAVFAGRLSAEKGIWTLLEAWRRMKGYPLRIAGGGPLLEQVRRCAAGVPGVEVLGLLAPEDAVALIRRAAFLVFPSDWYETFGRVTMEAFACGVPVLASRLGAMAEAVVDGREGLLFEPGNPDDLASKAGRLAGDAAFRERCGRAARAAFEARYTADRNYAALVALYARAVAGRRG